MHVITEELPATVYAARSATARHDIIEHLHIPPVSGESRSFASPNEESVKSSTIMIIDDEPLNVRMVRKYLHDAGYREFRTITDASRAFAAIQSDQPDAVLLDIVMPHVSGLDILALVRRDPRTMHIPVIILTAESSAATKLEALNLGATDFLAKPVEKSELVARLRNTLLVKAHRDQLSRYSVHLEHEVQLRTAELELSRREIIHCLATAAECRDDVTGYHIVRVSRYSAIIARQLGLSEKMVDLIEQAAKLHDVGKIGIPDSILLKPGKLTVEEFAVMKTHCDLGLKIIQPMVAGKHGATSAPARPESHGSPADASSIISIAAEIAATHHERWDGAGYPCGLAGEQIPLTGRITAVADVFDALSTARPYKAAFPLERCWEILEEGRGSHFDPRVLDAFLAASDEVIQVMTDFRDPVA